MGDTGNNRGTKEPLTAEEVAGIEAMLTRMAGNFYDVLGVDRTTTPEQVRDAYFQLSRRFHPDVFWRKDLGEHKAHIEAIFRELTMAFDTLSNPRKRIPYEERLAAREAQRNGTSGQRFPRVPVGGAGTGASSPNHPSASNPQTPSVSSPLVSPNGPVPGSFVTRAPTPPMGFPRAQPPQQPFVSRSPTLGATQPPFVSRSPTPLAVHPVVPNVRPHSPEGASPSAPEPLSDEMQRRRDAAARFGGVARAPIRGPATPAEPRPAHTTPDRVPSKPQMQPPVARTSDRPPPRDSNSLRRPSDRPPPPTQEGANALESLRHQLAERGQQPVGRVQPQAPAPPPNEFTRAEAEVMIAQARQSNDLAQLVAVLRRALAAYPDDESFRGRLDRAVSAQQDEAADALVEQARRAETARRWDLAALKWSQVAEARPMDITVLLSAAAALLEHGQDHARAAEFSRRATQLNPSSPRAHAMLARVFHEAGRAASARAALETALRLDPACPEVADMLRKINRR